MTPMSIPSPPLDWEVLLAFGGFKIHAYALAILVGIFVALWLTRRRWVARGGDAESMEEIAVWAIPFGIVGGRIYHVVSTPGPYFGEGGSPLDAFKIWDGGLGIWGAVAIGALGAYIGARRAKVSFPAFMDAVAPGVLIAQAIGRIGNYFNHELFGAPTTMPWGLSVDPAIVESVGEPAGTLFQPTFLYELLWNLAGAALLIYLDRRYRLRFGRMFWLYVVVYTSGRLWIEMLRIDTAVLIAGVRINVWVAIGTLLLGVGMFAWLGRRHRGQTDEFPARSLQARAAAAVTAKPAAKRPRAKVKAKALEAPEAPSVKRVAARAKVSAQEAPEGPSAKRVAAHAKPKAQGSAEGTRAKRVAAPTKGAPDPAAKRPQSRKPAGDKPKGR
jgi:prolipoprotein diacylglyceryl transferase